MGVEYMFDLICPHKIKSRSVRPAERGGQEASLPLLIQLFARLVFKKSPTRLPKCEGPPSCWTDGVLLQ